jgi:hypothetical protein
MQVEQLAIDLLSRIRAGEDYTDLVSELEQIKTRDIFSAISNDEKRKAFWINIYNSFRIIFLNSDPSLLENQKFRYSLFSNKKIIIGGNKLSLNNILHGILRHSKVWWAKGYLSKIYVKRLEKRYRVHTFDNRIHFAINYGSKSSPPIRVYESAEISHQLGLSTKLYLDSEVTFFEEENMVTVSQLFNWYAGDFGGRNGILKFLEEYEKVPRGTEPMIIYKPFSWSPEIRKFS